MPGGVALLVGEGVVPLVKEVLASEGLERIEVISFSESTAMADHSYLRSLLTDIRRSRICGMVSAQDILLPEGEKAPGPSCHHLVLGYPIQFEIDRDADRNARLILASFLWRTVAIAEAEGRQESSRELERAMSDNAAVLDIMKLVATFRDEEKVVSTVLDLFVTLFLPGCIWYASMDGPRVISVQHRGDTCGEGWTPPAASPDGYSPSHILTEDGFVIRIKHLGALVGCMEVRHLTYPNNRTSYLDMARSISPIFGLAISNARHIQDLTSMRNALMALNESLNITNKITRHDIRNELMVAHGSIEIFQLKGDPVKLDHALRSLEKIDRQLTQLKELDGMLSQGDSIREVDVRSVTKEVSRNYPLRVVVNGDRSVKADQALFSIMDNLFRNAMTHGKAESITVDIGEADGMVEVRVADDGKGIDPSIQGRIFEEGFTHGETKGTGLGLFIVARTIARYGGSITVGPNHPQGAVFTIRLPAWNSTGTA